MTENPSYYAVIPANVRYSAITPNAKLLYGEITALCNKTGVCYASNQYFANLYGVSKKSISKWIKELQEKGFVKSEIIYKEGSKEIVNRYVRIVTEPMEEKFYTPMEEKVKDNNTVLNNTNNKKEIYKEKFEEWWSYFPKLRAGSKAKTFEKYIKTIEKEKLTPEWLLERVKEYSKSKEVENGYACGGERYFNDCKYNNHYELSEKEKAREEEARLTSNWWRE